MIWSPLFHKLLGREWVESQIAVARRRDADAVCVCGDRACELPWSDGGAVLEAAE